MSPEISLTHNFQIKFFSVYKKSAIKHKCQLLWLVTRGETVLGHNPSNRNVHLYTLSLSSKCTLTFPLITGAVAFYSG